MTRIPLLRDSILPPVEDVDARGSAKNTEIRVHRDWPISVRTIYKVFVGVTQKTQSYTIDLLCKVSIVADAARPVAGGYSSMHASTAGVAEGVDCVDWVSSAVILVMC